MYIPADVVLIEEVTVLLKILVPNTASTLTLQLLPGVADNMREVEFPSTVNAWCVTNDPHMS